MENKMINRSFTSLGARVLYARLACYPEKENETVMDRFLKGAIAKLVDTPTLIGVSNRADDCFPTRFMLNNQNPQLMEAMLKIEFLFFNWVDMLSKLGRLGEVFEDRLVVDKSVWKLTAKTLDKLIPIGLTYDLTRNSVTLKADNHPGLFPQWKERSVLETEGVGKIQQLTRFLFVSSGGSRVFKAREMFGKLYEDAAFIDELETFFDSLGYELTNDERGLGVWWEKEYTRKERGYMRVSYRYRDRYPMCFEFRVPAFRLLLNHYDEMPEQLQRLCFSQTKPCNSCGYCTQTDKSGKREPLRLSLTFCNNTQIKCPLWPAFTWNEPDTDTLEAMKNLVLFSEQYI